MFEREQLLEILEHSRALPAESETVEFKTNFVGAESFGEYISALANAAALAGISHAFMIFGVEDRSHEIVGTTFEPSREKAKGIQDLIPWVSALLDPSTGLLKVLVTLLVRPRIRLVWS